MKSEVTVRNLNRAFMRQLFSSRPFWQGFTLYILGLILAIRSLILGSVIMLISALIMLNADWKGRQKVVKRLRWIK